MHCEACPYKGQPSIDVRYPTGKVKLMCVGEAPGREEIARNAPFVGPSGQLLRKSLQRAGAEGLSIHITNALLCRPPVDKQGPPSKEAILACRPRLLEEIRRGDPDVILAFGNAGMWAVLGEFGLKITQEQGRAIPWEGRIVVPVVHPANVLRRPGEFLGFQQAIRYGVGLARGLEAPKDPGETKFTVIRKETFAEVARRLRRVELVGADLETSGYNPRKHRILVLAVAWDKNKVLLFPGELLYDPDLREEWMKLFSSPRPRWVWHNGKFDTHFLRNLGFPARVDEDDLLLHYALCEIRGTHDLEQLAARYLGAPDYKAESLAYLKHKKKDSFALIPRPVLYRRVAKDADYTLQLWHVLRPQVAAEAGLERLYTQVLLPAADFLQSIERYGIWVKRERVEELRQKLAEEIRQAQKEILEIALPLWDPAKYARDMKAKNEPLEFNPNSPVQLKWLLYYRLGLKPGKGYKMDTREDTLKNLATPHPIVDKILKLRELQKGYSTYVKGILKAIEEDSRVHCTYLLHGTTTGRLASRGPNMQNIPRDPAYRGMFQAPPGRALMEFDYKSAELRVLAHLSMDPFLLKVFQEGRDLHDEVARVLYGPNFTKEQRVRAKAVNFGIPYGRDAYSIALEHKMSIQEAQKLIDDWFRRMPKAKEYIDSCRMAVVQGKTLQTEIGRKRRFGLVTAENLKQLQNEAANFAIQSLASDFTLISAMTAAPLLRGLDAHIVNLVHDSILVEVPDDPAVIRQVAKVMTEVMIETPKRAVNSAVPFDVEVKVGKEWGNLSELRGE